MPRYYADNATGIPAAIASNPVLAERMLRLSETEPMVGKCTEGGSREDRLRLILARMVREALPLDQAVQLVERSLPPHESPHSADKRYTFRQDWAERLVRTQLSRFYNQAVILVLLEANHSHGFVPHAGDGRCPAEENLAGRAHRLEDLLRGLTTAYGDGHFDQKDPYRLPAHPDCLHVVKPEDA